MNQSIRNGAKVTRKYNPKISASQVSTNAEVTELEVYMFDYAKALIAYLESAGANGVTLKIYGSADGTTYHLLATIACAASGYGYETISDAWAYLRVTIIDTIAASHGTLGLAVILK